MPNIKLQTSDGEIIDIDVQIAKCFGIIKTMFGIYGMEEEEDNDNTVVPLFNVNSAILRKVLHWVNHHKDDPQPSDDEDDHDKEHRSDDISLWDANFLDVDQGTIFQLILAANYLDIKGLQEVACKTLANMIKESKNPEEIRKLFNIKNDFTAADEEQRKLNMWCEE